MPATIDALQQRLDHTRQAVHGRCIACGSLNGQPRRLQFVPTSSTAVEAVFEPNVAHEGYSGILHGGVIVTLLDAAMTNCLFAQGLSALTADLHVRYRHPVASSASCELRAWVENASPPLFVMRAELRQAGKLRVTATGKFMKVDNVEQVLRESL